MSDLNEYIIEQEVLEVDNIINEGLIRWLKRIGHKLLTWLMGKDFYKEYDWDIKGRDDYSWLDIDPHKMRRAFVKNKSLADQFPDLSDDVINMDDKELKKRKFKYLVNSSKTISTCIMYYDIKNDKFLNKKRKSISNDETATILYVKVKIAKRCNNDIKKIYKETILPELKTIKDCNICIIDMTDEDNKTTTYLINNCDCDKIKLNDTIFAKYVVDDNTTNDSSDDGSDDDTQDDTQDDDKGETITIKDTSSNPVVKINVIKDKNDIVTYLNDFPELTSKSSDVKHEVIKGLCITDVEQISSSIKKEDIYKKYIIEYVKNKFKELADESIHLYYAFIHIDDDLVDIFNDDNDLDSQEYKCVKKYYLKYNFFVVAYKLTQINESLEDNLFYLLDKWFSTDEEGKEKFINIITNCIAKKTYDKEFVKQLTDEADFPVEAFVNFINQEIEYSPDKDYDYNMKQIIDALIADKSSKNKYVKSTITEHIDLYSFVKKYERKL